MKPAAAVKEYLLSKQVGYVDKGHNPLSTRRLLRLNMGENTAGVPTMILQQLGDLKQMIAQYPDQTYIRLVNAICSMYGISKDMVSQGTGANEIIERVSRAYLQSGDHMAVFNPTFYRFADAALRQGAKIQHIDLLEENNYDLTKEDAQKQSETKPKVLWLCSPNNPTGRIISLQRIDSLAAKMKETLICVDEAWGEYVDGWDQKHSAINLLKKHQNILIVRTFSKYYGMAGLILGYIIGPEQLIMPLNQMRLEFPVNGIAETLAAMILENRDSYGQYKAAIKSEVARVSAMLKNLSSIDYIPTSTSIIAVRHAVKDLYKELCSQGILTSDLSNVQGLQGRRYVRITIQPDRTKNDKLMKALQEIDRKNSF